MGWVSNLDMDSSGCIISMFAIFYHLNCAQLLELLLVAVTTTVKEMPLPNDSLSRLGDNNIFTFRGT